MKNNLIKPTILLVDDAPENLELLRDVLHDKYRLKAALDGEKALKIASSTPHPDLIILDILLPGMDGYQVCDRLKTNAQTRDIPVIFVSALDDTVGKIRALTSGGVDYITKPYQPEEVLARVETHLALWDLNRSLKEEIARREQAEIALQQANETLERRVQERTRELAEANARLKQEIQERIQVAQQNERLLERIRSLASYQQSVVEEERSRIAREIHDEFGQALTALKMDIAWLAKHLPPDADVLRDRATRTTELLDKTIQLVHRIARELRPGVLDELGLTAALEWQAQEFAERTGIPCALDLESEDTSFGRDLDTAIFRICQEALTNIARHAEATQVWIALKETPSHIVLTVRDNGKGITPEQIADAKSFGLIGMRERVRIWDGELSFTGASNQGTTITMHIPMAILKGGNDDSSSYRR